MKIDDFNSLRERFEGDEEYMDAINKAESLAADPDFNVYYDYEENLKKVMNLDIEQAKLDGLAEGLAKGQKQLICKMHKNGMNIQEISSILEIDELEIENLLKS